MIGHRQYLAVGMTPTMGWSVKAYEHQHEDDQVAFCRQWTSLEMIAEALIPPTASLRRRTDPATALLEFFEAGKGEGRGSTLAATAGWFGGWLWHGVGLRRPRRGERRDRRISASGPQGEFALAGSLDQTHQVGDWFADLSAGAAHRCFIDYRLLLFRLELTHCL
ncbi:hypothetical protein AB7M33_003743 [Pseudomonas sp. Y3 TE3536]